MVKSLILALFDFSFPICYLSLQARMDKRRDDLKKNASRAAVAMVAAGVKLLPPVSVQRENAVLQGLYLLSGLAARLSTAK